MSAPHVWRAVFRAAPRLAALGLLLSAAPAHAGETPRDAMRRAAEAYAAGRYAEAAEILEKVPESGRREDDADLLHNRAATLFKLGRVPDARELWVRAAAMRDPRFEAQCTYNLGNCDYAEALAGAQSGDVPGAIERLNRAAARYRDALRIDPALDNARANLELAHQLVEQLKQQSTTQPQSQSQPSSQGDGQQSQPSSQPSSQSQPSSDQSGEGGQQDDSQQQSSQPSESQPSQEPESEPQDESSNDNSSADEQQPQQPQSQPADSQPSPEEQFEPPPGVKLTREEVEQLLQRVREAERKRRLELQRREAARYQPVDKDW
ncbi:MAG: hypothetical protein CHACPFDD_02920 [Phycisphaerae bacterium]|nr:hypothetical protein [Phycisphaerae bacterium]